MERAYRISNLWNWLPAFRTVAETEHLPSAAKALHVSPSALSRSVKHLENEVGHPLFDRDGRKMKLNRAGVQLLAAVRDAMRRIDDGLIGGSATTHLHIAGPPEWLRLIVLPAIAGAPGQATQLCVEIVDGPPADSERALLRGEVDLIVSEIGIPGDKIAVEHLGDSPYVLCGRGVPDAEGEPPLAVWTGGRHDWSLHAKREVVLRTPHLAMLVDGCDAGRLQVVLPLAIARGRGLDVVRAVPLAPEQLYLARRHPLTESTIDVVVDRVRLQAARVLARSERQVRA